MAASALIPLTACGTDDRPAGDARRRTPAPTGTPTGGPPVHRPRLTDLERAYGARVGVYALATGTGATVVHRAGERFAFCSTFKALAAAAVLHHRSLSGLDRRVTYTEADVRSTSPVTGKHVATGMTLRELCDAAVRYSDGTAGNLLMRDTGGPAGLTAYLRRLGDSTSRMDHYEPELHDVPPDDPADTTTPQAIATDFRTLLLGTALPARERRLLMHWLTRNATDVAARRIRAGLPGDWKVADKTGTGDYGRANDIAIVHPPRTEPLVLAVMTDRSGHDSEPSDALIAEATRRTIAALKLPGLPSASITGP
ncbi:class A beta-lactamase [Streptomyces sp. 378]|uniref:class A beta-lactamase n=1 Tax=Streptomyces sp. 378 TaxID=3049412 RepID=UPI0024C32D54|nr:class A beta-lactamase [Streptomyces sp. 378]MDK1342154.1 class A beta-lactamase [Streptomyces sp. 378]